MADSDKELKIHIATTADTSGSGSVISEFEKIHERLQGVYQGTRDVRQIWYEMDRILPGTGQLFEAALTGPLGWIVALGFGVDKLTSGLKAMNEQFDAILSQDLTGPINQAQELAKPYTGIADAIAKANEEFNSAEGIFTRAQKGIEAQKGLSPEAKTNAELGNVIDKAVNATAQAALANQKVAGYKLPESDDVAKANADALKEQAKTLEDSAKAGRTKAQQITDTIITSDQGLGGGLLSMTTPGFWKDFGDRVTGVFTSGTSPFRDAQTRADALKTQGDADAALALQKKKEAAEIERQVEARAKDREDAKKLNAAAATATDERNQATNPNIVGSLAWQKAQQQRFGSGESALTGLIERMTRDISTTGPGAQTALKDLMAALPLALSAMKQLAAAGDNIQDFKREIDVIQAQLKTVSTNSTQ